jgi:cell division cycle 2-like protein
MSLSKADHPLDEWTEEEFSSLTKSGHILKEEHIGTWAEANKLGLNLPTLFADLRQLIDLGLEKYPRLPYFPCFYCIFEMGDHLNLPWKTVATAFNLLWRFAKTQVPKSDQITDSKTPLSPITPLLEFQTFFSSLTPKRIYVLSYGCLLLSSKLEETLFSLRQLEEIHANYMVHRGKHHLAPHETWKMKDTDLTFDDPHWLSTAVKDQEVVLLVELGFSLTIRHLAHFRLLRLMNALSVPEEVQSLAIFLANVSLLTPNVLIHRPKMYSTTLLHLAAQAKGYRPLLPQNLLPMSQDPPDHWWSLFNMSTNDLHLLSLPILQLLTDVQAKDKVLGEVDFVWSPNENELSQMRALSGSSSSSSAGHSAFCVTSSFVDKGEPVLEQSFLRCRSLSLYEKEKKINEGTYGTVFVGRDKQTREIVAIKKMKRTMSRSGFPYYMLREILFLFRLNHPNIVEGRAMVIEEKYETITFFIVMEFISTDMLSLVKYQASIPRENRIRLSQVKNVMIQLLSALAHMHDQGLMHRDLKLANLLLTREGVLKVADLGSIRDIGRTSLKLTTQIVTLWYRAPELLMGGTEYTHSIDLWSVGCLFVELLTLKPLFPGNSEIETMYRIFKILGRPNEDIWNRRFSFLPLASQLNDHLARFPNHSTLKEMLSFLSPAGHNFLTSVLSYDPASRISAKEALNHPFWYEKPVAQPINLEKIGMVTVFDEKTLEAEVGGSLSEQSNEEKFNYGFLKKQG